MTETGELTRLILRQVDENKGFLPFDRFMAMALYEPGLGYYEAAEVFGEKGDFVTAADLGPWLALGIVDLLVWGWENLGKPSSWTLLEQGSGSGRLLGEVLQLLQQRAVPFPADIIAVERSARMRKRQSEHFEALGLTIRQCETLAELEGLDPCLMFSNELPDAFPVKCFTWKEGQFFERGVGAERGTLVWTDAAEPLLPPPAIEAPLTADWPQGYVSEWNPNLAAWQRNLAGVIGHGYVFTVDYGYSRTEYYRPGRVTGTLLGHIGHRTCEAVLEEPGSMDITAHVDFTALVEAGLSAGLVPVSWLSQGAWLAQSPGVQQQLKQLASSGKADDIAAIAHAKRLLLPFGMGETFKLLIQSRGSQTIRPPYLSQFDRLSALQQLA